MKIFGKLIATLSLAFVAGLTPPAHGADPVPTNNDFILRAPAAEASGIASRNGLTIISQVATAVDEFGNSIYLVRAASGADPQMVVSDVETLEPAAAGIERAVLASLPKLDQSAAMILDTSAVDSALGAINGFDPPSATLSASWNGHLHDREIEAGKTEALEFAFEQAASNDASAYALQISFSDGSSALYDPAACALVVKPALEVSGSSVKWRLVNTSANVVTVDGISIGWPTANGDVTEIKSDGAKVYDQVLSGTSATVDTGWLDSVSKRQINPGSSKELELKWAMAPASDSTAYTLDVSTLEGPAAQYDAAGGPCATHVDDLVTVSGNEVRLEVSNYGSSDLVFDTATLTWPAANGKLLTARLHDDELLDVPYQKFGKNVDGSDREVWTGYLNQPATAMIELDGAQSTFKGQATVAIIDTGIDPTHALLADNIVPGYDFINDVAGTASEWADLDQSAAMILDQSAAMILDQSAAMILDQSAAMILDQSAAMILDTSTIPPAFGHGTMVAGIIHRVAPEASLMPLKAFDANGHAHLYDIIDAIYFAVDNGANVINMSFNMDTYSPALMRAINYAARSGVACIASAGNRGQEILVFPAAFGNTIGVASVDDSSELSAFSNWGSDLVTIAAPGENVVTTFPGSRFAVASGTSFSAPWIAGGAALFADKLGSKLGPGLADYYLSTNALSDADDVTGSGSGRAGYGRANLRKAVERVKSGRYASNRPLGVYTLSATFAEGCAANYPPPSTGGGCAVEGAGQLKFDSKKVFWELTNTSEIPVTLDSLTISWESDNGELRKAEVDGEKIMEAVQPAANTVLGAPWLGAVEDRTFAPHQTRELIFEFQHDVVWTY